jgi:para-nitrobenzyl esterase
VDSTSRVFNGIPFAAPPVGELRWRPPQPAAPWAGVRDATTPGSSCPQGPGLGGIPSKNEDCLYLNVTTPRSAARRGGRLPVLVFIHGGGFTTGSGSTYDARAMAARGGVVVVTVNYRLGVFGFLAHPALDGPRLTSGQFGLEDQRAALRWVRRNAAAFGGDPRNVTVSGESAGAMSVCAQLASPAAAGLFQRAVIQSGPCGFTGIFPPLRSAEQAGTALAAGLGCVDPHQAAACLRAVPVDTLLERGADDGLRWAPPAGGPELPLAPQQAFRTGRFNRVPVVVGTNRDEERLFVGGEFDGAGHPVTAEQYPKLLAESYGAAAAAVLAHYPLADYPTPSVALAAVRTDDQWACAALRDDHLLATRTPTYAYEFADRDAPPYLPVPGFPMGAFHAAELQYLYTLPLPLNPAQRALSDQMIGYWTRFAAVGRPGAVGAPEWPRFRPSSDQVLALAPGAGGTAPVSLAREHQCAFWAGIPRG